MLQNDDDDRCQHSDQCPKSMFTFCPHCHLFLCITHLKEHHDMMKNDISQMLTKADHQRSVLEQQIDKIKQQQIALNQFYERELKQLNERHELVVNICTNRPDNHSFHSSMRDHEKYMKQFETTKLEEASSSIINQIDQLLQRHNQATDSKDEEDQYSNRKSTIDSSIDDSLIESQQDMESENVSLNAKWLINLPTPVCPLSYANAFGLSSEHKIVGVPCDLLKDATALTYGRCYYHLMTYHRLKPSIAKIIMRTISSHENSPVDPSTIDIFSKWSSNDILSQSRSLFVSQCPLTEENVFGLQRHHNVALCTPRAPVHLYQHLITYHRFKTKYALRFVGALLDKEPLTNEIFKPNEQVINTCIRTKHRGRH